MSQLYEPYDPSAGATYPPVAAEDIAFVEIFPPIGVARVGDSGSTKGKPDGTQLQYFYTPEIPNSTDPPGSAKGSFTFRDPKKKIKRQAARFRIYAYDSDGNILGELNASNQWNITWSVEVVNAKASTTLFRGRFQTQTTDYRNPDVQPDLPEAMRDRLIVQPDRKKISGTKANPQTFVGKFQGSRPDPSKAVEVHLGELRTDGCGRLVFIGGSGYAHSVQQDVGYQPDKDFPEQPDIMSEFDNIDWVDDTCDGIITATVSSGTTTIKARHKAGVMVAPPKFAYGINAPTSLWDIAENIYNKSSSNYVADATVQFYRDIWPILLDTYGISWVNQAGFDGHGPNAKGNFMALEKYLATPGSQYKEIRQHIFSRLRMPDQMNPDQASTKYMPRLSGDGGDAIEPGTIQTVNNFPNAIRTFASLTSLQYERFKRWKNGDFKADPYPASGVKKLEDVAITNQPEYLTRAHLQTTIGDPVYPGIETYWIAKRPDCYDLNVDPSLNPPFRLHKRISAGDMSKALSLPWQSDFSQCNLHWWPTARPDDVVPVAYLQKLIDSKTPPTEIAAKLNQNDRKSWTRLLRLTPNDGDGEFFPGCTDMVRFWSHLGFIVKKSFSDPDALPVFVEVERTLYETS